MGTLQTAMLFHICYLIHSSSEPGEVTKSHFTSLSSDPEPSHCEMIWELRHSGENYFHFHSECHMSLLENLLWLSVIVKLNQTTLLHDIRPFWVGIPPTTSLLSAPSCLSTLALPPPARENCSFSEDTMLSHILAHARALPSAWKTPHMGRLCSSPTPSGRVACFQSVLPSPPKETVHMRSTSIHEVSTLGADRQRELKPLQRTTQCYTL